MVELKLGSRIIVGDFRNSVAERVIAEGNIKEIKKEPDGNVRIDLHTGFYLIIEGTEIKT